MTTALTPSPLDVVESDGHVEVTLEGPRGPVEVWLRETYSEPIFTMCRAHAPGPVRQWELIEVRGSTPLDNRISQPKV